METGLRLRGKDGYRLLYTFVLVCIVLTVAGGFLGIAEVGAVHILTAAVVMALSVGMQILPGKGRALYVVLTVVFFTVITAAAGTRQWGLFLTSWFRWMAGMEGWAEEWSLAYELLQAAVVSLVCYLLQLILERFVVIKVITADILISLLLFCLLTEWKVSHTGVVFSCSYIVMVYIEWLHQEWKKAGSRDRKKYMLWLMPFVALYFFLMLLMPTPEKPYEWRFVRETCSQIGDCLMSLTQNFMRGGGEDFDMSLSGFSGEGELGDGIEENNREIMALQGTGNLVTNVYLAGRIYDTFDGRGWLQENHDAEVHTFQDTVQTQAAARDFEAGCLKNYLSAATLRVRYKYFRTACLFAPLKTSRIRMQGENNPYYWDGDNLLFRKRKGYGTEYEINYYQINVGAEQFDRFLRSAGAAEVDEEWTRRIYDVYTDDPVLSGETELYLEEIAGNAYDRLNWLRMIEQELSSYTYTRQPGELPDGITDAGEFLDYFLLEGREGYCAHFATAFALLARTQGMPSRYVQGFCVPMKTSGEVSVQNDMAHAWPEVYFDGVGWIPFEPTPGYSRLRYTPWETEQREETIEAYREESVRESKGGGEPAPSAAWEQASEENRKSTLRFLGIAARGAVAVCMACCIILVLQRIVTKGRYRRMDAAGRFRLTVSANIRVLAVLGFRRDERETLQEFRGRVVREGRCAGCRLQFIADYEEILYGEKKAEEEMLKTAMEERDELMRVLKEKRKWRYFFFYYRLTV